MALASLSELFSQKLKNNEDLEPYVNSKYQERVFCEAFGAMQQDTSNTAYDVSLRIEVDGKERMYAIGIKTFKKGFRKQKIAQMKKNAFADFVPLISEIEDKAKRATTKEDIDNLCHDDYMKLARKISYIRNERMDSSFGLIKGFGYQQNDCDEVESVYHVLMPSREVSGPVIFVGEVAYDKIDIDNIQIKGCTDKSHPVNFSFSDGMHTYLFTFADSQLLMDFNNEDIVVEKWPIEYNKSPFDAIKFFLSDYNNQLLKVADNTLQYCPGEPHTGNPEIFIENMFHANKRPQVIESFSWPIDVKRYSGFNMFYGVGSKLGKSSRQELPDKLYSKFSDYVPEPFLTQQIKCVERYINWSARNEIERKKKEQFRDEIMSCFDGRYPSFEKEIFKSLYRVDKDGNREVYIPIPNSARFHRQNPDFFAPGIGLSYGESKKSIPIKEQRKFQLIFEPSGKQLNCFITQDSGKGIESCEKQAILGEWILGDVFRLNKNKREPLTKQKLDELGLNGIRLYKTNEDDSVHIMFIYFDTDSPPNDYFD